MFHIALYEPQIAPNTGNIIRLCANNGCHLHLIGKLGFSLDEKKLRRAGLDYGDLAQLTHHKDYASFIKNLPQSQIFACTTKGTRSHNQAIYKQGDILLFGSETSGLPTKILNDIPVTHRVRIPMQPHSRSLNLSNSVAIMSYEAWRQHNFLQGC